MAFPQAKQELAAINGELNRSTLGAKTLSETEQWHEMELRMEREIDINDVARGEIDDAKTACALLIARERMRSGQ